MSTIVKAHEGEPDWLPLGIRIRYLLAGDNYAWTLRFADGHLTKCGTLA